jgi:hypothetical protein
MSVDARAIPCGMVVETEVCIVGAGAAGITLAREFSGSPFRVTLLESGGMEYEQDTQDLYESQRAGLPFESVRVSRLRFFGGTTNHWGGHCLPLDPIDFGPRDDFPYCMCGVIRNSGRIRTAGIRSDQSEINSVFRSPSLTGVFSTKTKAKPPPLSACSGPRSDARVLADCAPRLARESLAERLRR